MRAQKQHKPCPCGKSSDAFTEYPDGGFCFSCNKKFTAEGRQINMEKSEYTLQALRYRGHSDATIRKYRLLTRVSTETGEPIGVQYVYPDGKMVKVRYGGKAFAVENHSGPGLYGKDIFPAGCSKYITVTEGEEDAASVWEMLGEKYPAVSVQSASSAKRDCTADYDYLNAFDRIYLCFDNDAPGRRAIEEVASLFPYDKIYVVKKTKYKDANEFLQNGASKDYVSVWWSAKRYDPECIVSSFSEISEILQKPPKTAIATYPWDGLQEATLGIRTGEVVLIKALEGVGKTEFLGAIEYHVVKTTKVPIAVIHLEEDLRRTICRFVNYEIKEPVHLPEKSRLDSEKIFSIYKDVVKDENRVHFYKSVKNDDNIDSFIAAVRFMVAKAGCKIVFFDHISRMASSIKTEDERKFLDYLSTAMAKLAEELDFALIEISHVNDDGLTRGSRNISKEAFIVLSLSRDITAIDAQIKNETKIVIEKNRPVSITGPVASVFFDQDSFTLSEERPVLPPLRVDENNNSRH